MPAEHGSFASKISKKNLTGKFNPELLERLLRINPKLRDVAFVMNMNPRGLRAAIRRHYGCSFLQLKETLMITTKERLVNTIIDLAMGDEKKKKSPSIVALIFALKNLCGWSDNQTLGLKDGNGKTLDPRKLPGFQFYSIKKEENGADTVQPESKTTPLPPS